MVSKGSPLILPADLFPDMSDEEMANEVELMFIRAKAIYDAISGNISVQEMAELVEHSGIDIDQWAITCDDVSGTW